MNCPFCQKHLSDYPPHPNIPVFIECNECKTHLQYSGGKLHHIKTRAKIDDLDCLLLLRFDDQKAWVVVNNLAMINTKSISMSWELASSITPSNIQKRLKSFLSCMVFL